MEIRTPRRGERGCAVLGKFAQVLGKRIKTSGPRPYFLGQLWPFVLVERF